MMKEEGQIYYQSNFAFKCNFNVITLLITINCIFLYIVYLTTT